MQIRLIPPLFSTALLAACGPSGPLEFAGSPVFASSQDISGPATIVDGDSLAIDGIRIRLFGVDAFEAGQDCTLNGRVWACGANATGALAQLVGTATIVCEQRDLDSYGRTVARCTNGTVDLSAELARAGLALAYRKYSSDYIDEEAEAEAGLRGAWAGTFVAPWDFRRDELSVPYDPETYSEPVPGADRSGDCYIKGNINREGERIYHLPGGTYYDVTVIDESRGERRFCSEAEAIAAGWRAPQAP